MDGNEKILLDRRAQLRESNLREKARPKGLRLQPDGSLLVESFARDYRVCRDCVTAVDSGPVSFKQELAVVSYILSEGGGNPSLEFVPFGRLGGFNIGRDRHEDRSLKQPILATFALNYRLLQQAALKMGGRYQPGNSTYEHVWLFHAFPKLRIRLSFLEADEEFPADANVSFDSKALDFLGLECLGFLPAYFTETLFEAAQR